MFCPYCRSQRVEIGVSWGKSTETGNVGLKYTVGGWLTGVAEVYSDLCLDCKSIIRTYIKEETDKDWSREPGSLGSK